jgi:hypothetical protein
MAASCCIRMTWRFAPPYASVVVLVLCVWPMHQSGTDLSCEEETCRGGSCSGKLVRDAANWPKTGRLPVWVLTRVPSPPCPESLP